MTVRASLAAIKPVERRQERTTAAVYRDISERWVELADLYVELGRSISEARRAHLLTQAALAEALGLTHDQVARYEAGDRWKSDPPAIEQIVKYLEGLSR